MSIPLILPKQSLQCFFGIALQEDFTLDLAAIKKDLPAVYWQLPSWITVSQSSVQSSAQYSAHSRSGHSSPGDSYNEKSTSKFQLIQQRLWCGDDLFSQIILSVSDHVVTLSYLQLLPSSPLPCELTNNRYRYNFVKKYGACVQKTIRQMNKLISVLGATGINATLLNPTLAALFLRMGYLPVTPSLRDRMVDDGQHILPTMDQYPLIFSLPNPPHNVG